MELAESDCINLVSIKYPDVNTKNIAPGNHLTITLNFMSSIKSIRREGIMIITEKEHFLYPIIG